MIRVTLLINDPDRYLSIKVKRMSSFVHKWKRSSGPGFGEKVREAVKPGMPLRPRLEQAIRQIQVQVAKLESTSAKLKERDNAIFNKVVSALQKHDQQHASIYANELAEIRKMHKLVSNGTLAMEQIVLRLSTVQELGDIAVTLTPAMGVIRNVKSKLISVLPEAENEIGEISGLLNGILVDASQMGGAATINLEGTNDESEKILKEAVAVAEEKIRDDFPDLPSVPDESKEPTGYT